MMPTGERVSFILKDKDRVKSHVALQHKTLTQWINEAVKEKIERDRMIAPKVVDLPKVIIASAHSRRSKDED